jgi:hypothetical protein
MFDDATKEKTTFCFTIVSFHADHARDVFPSLFVASLEGPLTKICGDFLLADGRASGFVGNFVSRSSQLKIVHDGVVGLIFAICRY